MRRVGSRVVNRITDQPRASGLEAGGVIQRTAAALAAVSTTGMAKGVYRFRSRAEANRHAEEAEARAIAANLRARKLIP